MFFGEGKYGRDTEPEERRARFREQYTTAYTTRGVSMSEIQSGFMKAKSEPSATMRRRKEKGRSEGEEAKRNG